MFHGFVRLAPVESYSGFVSYLLTSMCMWGVTATCLRLQVATSLLFVSAYLFGVVIHGKTSSAQTFIGATACVSLGILGIEPIIAPQ